MSLNPLDQITWWVIAIVPVVFLFVFFALRKWFVAPYVAVLRARERDASAADQDVAAAEATLAAARERADKITAAAKEHCDGIAEDARKEADEYHRRVVESAVERSADILREGRARIETQRADLREGLRVQAMACVTAACERTLGKADPRVVGGSVDRALDAALKSERG